MLHELLLPRLNGPGLPDAFSSRPHTLSCDAFEGCMRGSHGSLWPRLLVRVLSRLGVQLRFAQVGVRWGWGGRSPRPAEPWSLGVSGGGITGWGRARWWYGRRVGSLGSWRNSFPALKPLLLAPSHAPLSLPLSFKSPFSLLDSFCKIPILAKPLIPGEKSSLNSLKTSQTFNLAG